MRSLDKYKRAIGRPRIWTALVALLALCLPVGCGSDDADRIAAATAATSSSPSRPLEPVSAIDDQILAAARTPVAYDAHESPRVTALNGSTDPVLLLDPALRNADADAGGASADRAGGADSSGRLAVGSSTGAVTASGVTVQQSISRMGLITMRKIVVPESTTRRVVSDRDRDRRESPADKRGGKNPSPLPTPARRFR